MKHVDSGKYGVHDLLLKIYEPIEKNLNCMYQVFFFLNAKLCKNALNFFNYVESLPNFVDGKTQHGFHVTLYRLPIFTENCRENCLAHPKNKLYPCIVIFFLRCNQK